MSADWTSIWAFCLCHINTRVLLQWESCGTYEIGPLRIQFLGGNVNLKVEELKEVLCITIYAYHVLWRRISYMLASTGLSCSCLLFSLCGTSGGCYGGTDQPSQRWIRTDSEALRGSRAFIRKMGNKPLFHKEPLAFSDETNVCV